MSVVRIRKRLDLPIPQLPELAPLIGKDVEIIAREQSGTGGDVHKPARFGDLKGGWPEDQIDDGFEEEVDRWRQEPWRASDATADESAEGH
jgi:hypothetical protein